MSVATEYVPVVAIPERARLRDEPRRLAPVVLLHAPTELDSPPLRLTRRGVMVLAATVALVSTLLVMLAAGSAPAAPAAPAHRPAAVTVRAGDSLWSIATRVAPDRDPRAEVDALQAANHLTGATVLPGQVLRVP